MKTITFYISDDDNSPIEEFLDSLNSLEAQKVAWTLKAIREITPIPPQYFKKLVNTDDI